MWYPAKVFIHIPEEDIAQFQWQYDDLAKAVGRKHYIASWMSVNMVVNISWESWINLDPLLRRAIELEVESIIQARESERAQQKRELETMQAQRNTELKFLDTSSSVIGNMLRR
jgi:hypothetical protein